MALGHKILHGRLVAAELDNVRAPLRDLAGQPVGRAGRVRIADLVQPACTVWQADAKLEKRLMHWHAW